MWCNTLQVILVIAKIKENYCYPIACIQLSLVNFIIIDDYPLLIFLILKVSKISAWLYCWVYREGNGSPLQYSCLENPMDGGAWCAAMHRVAKSWARLSDFTFTFHFHALEKEMATHSSVLAWRIPGTGEPGRLLFMGSHRVRHDWSDLAAAAAARVFCIFWITDTDMCLLKIFYPSL